MTPERWQEINKIFQSALDLDESERRDYLDKACADDESLRGQVETLIAADDKAGTFIDGNAASDAAHLLDEAHDLTLSGNRIEHYEIISVLGSGGMGKVYLAKDSKLNRSIAIKTLPDSFARRKEHVKRFQTEAKAAATLNHPNVATVYSVEETGEPRYFITMEYVEGRALSELIPPGGVDLRSFLGWFVSLADALSHAHSKGVIHRDIKPNNIMITESGNPKILDFGLARIDRPSENEASTLSLTKTGQVLGTPAYMAPEQAEGKGSDNRTDIFSLGVIMYEAITGEKPFKGDNYASIISDLLTKQPTGVAELRPDVPALVARLIMKCLEKNPQNRYQSMDEVRVILSEVNSALGSGAALSQPAARSTTRRSWTKPLAAAAGMILLGLISGLAYIAFFAFDSGGEVGRFNLHLHDGDLFNLTDARLLPDGRSVVFAAKLNDKRVLRLRRLDSYESSLIRGTEGANDPFISPDGRWVGFLWANKGVRKVPIEGGNPVTICTDCRPVSGIDWGVSGNIVFSEKDGLSIVSSDGGEVRRVTSLNKEKGERSHYEPHFLPNGKDFVFTVDANNTKKIAVYSAAGNSWKYVEGIAEGTYANFADGRIFFTRDEHVFAGRFDPASLKLTSEPKQVLEGIFSFFPLISVAENGTLLYMPSMPQNDSSLVWVDKQGNEEPALPDKKNFGAPRISPDAKSVALTIDGDIWVREFGSTRGVRLSSDGNASYPIWAPDGDSVLFTVEKDNTWKIYRKKADGSGSTEEIYSSDVQIRPNSIHPTENIIALAYFPSRTRGNIGVVDIDSGKLTSIVENKFTNDMPRFSPDGKWIAYFSVESGKTQIFAIPWKTEGPRKLMTEQTGMYPVFSRDSKSLYSRTPSKTFVTSINTSGGLKPGKETKLFEGQYRAMFDVSPNNDKLLMVKTERGIFPTYLHVVTNWTSELDSLVP